MPYFNEEAARLTDVEYIEPVKKWPPDHTGSPRESCMLDGSIWTLLKSWICGREGRMRC